MVTLTNTFLSGALILLQSCPWTGTRNKFQPEFAFFGNRSGLESIFHLPEQEQKFLNLRLILFMKGFLQLIAQFSRIIYLKRARLLNVVNEFAFACQFKTSRTDSISKDKMNWSRVW